MFFSFNLFFPAPKSRFLRYRFLLFAFHSFQAEVSVRTSKALEGNGRGADFHLPDLRE
jgi:hypothetical protein